MPILSNSRRLELISVEKRYVNDCEEGRAGNREERKVPDSVPLRRMDSKRKLLSSASPSALCSNAFQPSASSWRSGTVYCVCVHRSASTKAVVYIQGVYARFSRVERETLTMVSPSTEKRNIPKASWAIRASVQDTQCNLP